MKGIKRSEKTRKKISEARKRMGFSEEHRQHIKESKINKIYTDEERYRMGNGMRGKQGKNKGKHWKIVDGKRIWY